MGSQSKIKCLFICFFLAIVIATGMFIFYISLINKKQETGYLKRDESSIEDRNKRPLDPFWLCVYPETSSHCWISWSGERGISGGKTVQMVFSETEIGKFAGMHLYCTIALDRHVGQGVFEFWVKGGRGCRFVNKLNLYLKDNQVKQEMAYISLPIRITKEWQRISFPLRELLLYREGGDITREFSWIIQELLFSVEPVRPDEPAELCISGIRITDGKEIIYDVL